MSQPTIFIGETVSSKKTVTMVAVQLADGVTPITGLAGTAAVVTRKLNGSYGASSGTLTEATGGSGHYDYEFVTSEVDTEGKAEAIMSHASMRQFTAQVEVKVRTWDEILTGATYNIKNSSGKILRQTQGSGASGTATAGGNNTITFQAGSIATNDIFNGLIIAIVDGTGAGQARVITDYVGSSLIATVDFNWIVNPDNTSEYIAYGYSGSVLTGQSLDAVQLKIVSDATAFLGADLTLMRKIMTNTMTLSNGLSNIVVLDDDDSTPLITFSQLDVDSGSISVPVGAPAIRGKGV